MRLHSGLSTLIERWYKQTMIAKDKINNEKLWNKTYLMLLILGVTSGGASQMVNPIISKYAISLGTSVTVAGTLSSMLAMAAMFCRPFSGMVADRLNRKRLMISSTAITALCVIGYSIFNSVIAFFVLRIIHGLAFAFFGVANMAFAASFIPKSKLGEGLGYLSLGHLLPQALGPTLGIWLSDKFGYSVCFIISATLSIVSALLMLSIHYDPPAKIKRHKLTLNNLFSKKLLLYTAILVLFSSGNGLITSYLAILGDVREIANVGLFFTVYSIGLLFVRPVAGKLLDRKGLAIILYPAIVLTSVGMIVLGAAKTTMMVLASGLLKAFGQGAGTPSIQSYSIKKLGPENAGVATSTCFIGQDIGNAFSPIIGGIVVSTAGYDTLFYGYAVLLLIAGIGIYSIQQFIERKEMRR